MAAIVYLKDKKSGTIYAYESVSHWDKKKKQSRAKRKCIGKLDPETGEIIPNRKWTRKTELENQVKRKTGPVPVTQTTRKFYGATYLFKEIGNKIGLVSNLKKCFPDTYKQILSIAYYLILEDKNPLSRFPKWSKLHKHPYDRDIPSQRSSELFASISEEKKSQFFKMQGKNRTEKEYWAYDTTSISSYSNCLKQVKYGKNKDNDPLPQINLALLFGEKSNIPFYYRKLPGNITDVKTVNNLLSDMEYLGYKKVKLVMDRGFYSEANVNALYQRHLKFLMGTRLNLKYVNNELDKMRDELQSWTNYNQEYELYAKSSTISWNFTQKRPYKGDEIKEKRRMYLHLYYNSERAVEDERKQNILLSNLYKELESGNIISSHEKLYAKYFEVIPSRGKGVTIKAKQETIKKARKLFGYFALISNAVKDPIEAIEIYRNKDLIEKAFGNLKERLNFRRTLVSSDLSLDGKLFVEFVALIHLSYIKKKMQDNELLKKYTMNSLLDEFDIIECYEQKGRKLRWGEITKKQAELYQKMGLKSPSL